MKAIGQFTQGIAAYDAGKFTRKMMKLNARYAEQDGVAEADRIRGVARQQMGEQIVAQGSSGFTPGTGSALDALRESAIGAELDILTVRRRARISAQGMKVKGDEAYAAGYGALVGGIMGGITTIAESAAGAAGGMPTGGGSSAPASGAYGGTSYSSGAYGGTSYSSGAALGAGFPSL